MTPMSAQPKRSVPPLFFRLLNKLNNPFMKWLLASPLHGIVSSRYMLIGVTGRKSGTLYTIPVQYKQVEGKLYVVTSEGYTWWRNLRGGAEVTLRVRGQIVRAHASVSTDADAIRQTLAYIYPAMTAEALRRFAPGKVAITLLRAGGY
jgi:deazaflavin-dependent oxidoreductase (nitroreductase family)